MSQDQQWWEQILVNHGLPRELHVPEVELMIGLGEGQTNKQLFESLPYKNEKTVQAKFSHLCFTLDLRQKLGRGNRLAKGEPERLLREWIASDHHLDLLYGVYMHVTPDDQSTPDCGVEACNALWGKQAVGN
jgi:hypothetical protein